MKGNQLMNITTQTPATQTTQQTAPTPFDPTICFTCFGDYVEALLGIEQAEGPEVAFSAFKILADICLYRGWSQPPPLIRGDGHGPW